MASADTKGPSLFQSVLTNKCPHCRRGKLFISSNPYDLKRTMQMPEHCPVCGQKFEVQTGFYFGTGYVSYGLSIMVIAAVFVAWSFTLGLSIHDNSIFICLAVCGLLLFVLQPVLQRLSRSIWIAFFVRYDPEWSNHRQALS